MHMWKSITLFVIRALLTAIPPLAVAAGMYIWLDPFGILDIGKTPSVPAYGITSSNKGIVSMRAIENGYDKYAYDSFIFGSSISIAYPAKEWAKYLPPGASPVHFDSSNEGAGSMNRKVQWLVRKGMPIHNAIVILSPKILEAPTIGSYIPYIDPPGIATGITSWWEWHYNYFKGFLSRDFYISYLPYLVNGQPVERTHTWIFEKQPIVYDPVLNEETVPEWEHTIDTNPEDFYKDHQLPSASSIRPHCSNAHRLTPDKIEAYENIAHIFSSQGTDFKIIIGPELDCDTISLSDLQELKRIFGAKNVYNYSTPTSGLVPVYTDYIDVRHYRPCLAKKILERTYKTL